LQWQPGAHPGKSHADFMALDKSERLVIKQCGIGLYAEEN